MSVRKVFRRMVKSEPFQNLARELKVGNPHIQIRRATGSLTSFVLAWIEEVVSEVVIVICPTEDRAEALRNDLELVMNPKLIGLFPALDVSRIQGKVTNLDLIGLRVEALEQLRQASKGIVVVPFGALMGHTIPPDLFSLSVQEVQVGQEIVPDTIAHHLVEIGYVRVNSVDGVGQFSIRGGIFDVCSFGNELAIRMEFWGDEIISIRTFNLDTQRSVVKVPKAILLPVREVILTKTMEEEYDRRLEEAEKTFDIDFTNERDRLSTEGLFDSLELYLGLLYGEETCLLDHIPQGCLVMLDSPEGFEKIGQEVWDKGVRIAARQLEKTGLNDSKGLFVKEVLHTPQLVLNRLSGLRKVINCSFGGNLKETIDFEGGQGPYYDGHLRYFKEEILRYSQKDYENVLLCESSGQRARIEELLEETSNLLSIYVGTLHAGFTYGPSRIFLANDHEIYSRHRRKHRYRRFQEGSPIKALSTLKRGDFVVHVDHGIGRYQGLERITVDRISRDCLVLCYQSGDRVFVPVEKMGLVKKYSSEDGLVPVLSKLGTVAWERLKERTRKEIFKIAAELVSLYAERKTRSGFRFLPDTVEQQALEASFPYQETLDQIKAIQEVKTDMEAPSPMDRLICGDVGYGKTEVAIRAAFKAVANSKQVAILAPTTILAQQHFRTFQERMVGLPVRVEVLSRFRTRAEQNLVLEKLKSGFVDILIGTHRILSKDIKFKDLGLLVVDEEHRFGVRHKERLKQMKRVVDVLTLTATPIPRTLHMSLMGTRDISVIQTPPKDRLPIQTEILPFEEDLVSEAILREVGRGGQIYFVHNRIQSMKSISAYLERLLPEVRFGVGHGQMAERDLEQVMMDFLEQKYDCLISTMIIESGLDIPNVNTLIVNRSDRLGLAQLYQLRGRVGRASQRAYAYLLIPSWKSLGKSAVRRLRAIEEFSGLGSGFQISMRDLEIRGTGNLLGSQQHGHISLVGFDLYTRLLDEAIRHLNGEQIELIPEPEIQVSSSSFIPEDYIPNVDERMQFYQRLGDANQTVEILAIEEELLDRFGPVPNPTFTLLGILQIKILARQLQLRILKVGEILFLGFFPTRVFKRKDVEEMVKRSPLPLQFSLGDDPHVEVILEGEGAKERLECAKKVLQCLV